MQIKSIVAGAAIALAASSISVSAAEKNPPIVSNGVDFVALVGIPVEPLGADELATTRGAHWLVVTPGTDPIDLPDSVSVGPFSSAEGLGGLAIRQGGPTTVDFQLTGDCHCAA